jgi:hypothetical protein
MPLQSAPTKERVVVKSHPGGVAGAMMSLDEVAKRMWASRNDPRVRAWTTKQLVEAGNPTGARDKMQVILDAFRARVKYVPDPVHTEFMAGAVQTLCLDDSKGLCIVGADCDDQAIALGAAYLSVGIPVQVVGASYKEPVDQPSHVYIRALDDMGAWVPVDPTTKFEVGSAHTPARTWHIDPNKGVGAAGLPGGDFVGVGRGPMGVEAPPAYASLLEQIVSSDLPSMQSSWASVQSTIASLGPNDPCQHDGPAWLVSTLQNISDEACAIAHAAAQAAFGYTTNCGGAGASEAQQAEAATVDACDLRYDWPGPQWGPYGTVYLTGAASTTCLDPEFVKAVGVQVAAAERAVASAQATAAACAAAGASRISLVTSLPRVGPRLPAGALMGVGEWGLGVVTPGDVLAYRVMWDQYVLDTVRTSTECSKNMAAVAAKQSDAGTKATLSQLSDAMQKQSDALLAQWNLFQNSSSSYIVLQGAEILKSFQQTVISAGSIRSDVSTGPVSCALTYTDAQGVVHQCAPGADPSVQAQVIARIEGLGILADGVLQILVETGENTLAAAGSAAQWLAKGAENTISALATPWPWIAVIAVAGGVILWELRR